MALVDWEDLAISVRKSPRKIYNVLKDELNLPKDWNELSVIERRSRKRRYNIIRDTVDVLPPWNELPVLNRRSHKELYKTIKVNSDNGFSEEDVVIPAGTVIFEEDFIDNLDSYDDVFYIYNRDNLTQEATYDNSCLFLPSIDTNATGFLPIQSLEGTLSNLEIEIGRPTLNNEVNIGTDKTIGFFIYNDEEDFKAIYVTQLSLGWKWWIRSLYYDENEREHHNVSKSETMYDEVESVKMVLENNTLMVEGIEDTAVEIERNGTTKYGLYVNNRGATYSQVKITTI